MGIWSGAGCGGGVVSNAILKSAVPSLPVQTASSVPVALPTGFSRETGAGFIGIALRADAIWTLLHRRRADPVGGGTAKRAFTGLLPVRTPLMAGCGLLQFSRSIVPNTAPPNA